MKKELEYEYDMHYLKFSIKRQVVYEKVPPAGAQKKLYNIYKAQ